MTELNAEQVRRAIVDHTRRLAESATAAGPDAAVPTAPKWTITGLVEHVGRGASAFAGPDRPPVTGADKVDHLARQRLRG